MTTDFPLLQRQLVGLTEFERDPLANCANFVALLYQAMPDINWLGIYLLRGSDLVLGPFQGLPACVRIPLGQGVCGTAAKRRITLRIDDVHEFDGHIACDPVSRSELVVPLILDETLLGVIDIDSPSQRRFSADDQQGVEQLRSQLLEQLRAHNPDMQDLI